MARLTAELRKNLPSSAFAGPGRSYPVNDPSHARNALSRVAQFGSVSVKKKVRGKVHKRFPAVGKNDKPGKNDKQDQMIAHFLKAPRGK